MDLHRLPETESQCIQMLQQESFENIHLDFSAQPGKCRFADSGFAWKPNGGGEAFTVDRDNLQQASTNSDVHQFDGFSQEDFDRIIKVFKSKYSLSVDSREHAIRGWNWGKGDFTKAELSFTIQNKPAFEIPYTEIDNTQLAGKNEVSVEFKVPRTADDSGANESLGGAFPTGKKLGGARDQLVEARFYIPGTAAVKKEKLENGDTSEHEDGEQDDVGDENAAQVWFDTLMDKADIGEVAGDTFATFQDVLHLTPRGRFDIDMYESSFRLRGKTYDYKIQYESAKKYFLLPKTDDVHQLIVVGLDPPLRQGQTRYPFIVMQFKKNEDIQLDLNLTTDQLNDKYKDKLQSSYDGPIWHVVTSLFRGLGSKKVIQPAKDFQSRSQQAAVKCSIKANEGHLYCMDKSFLFVPKPATYISRDKIKLITMSRVGGAVSASRTFDINFSLKTGEELQFSNINREEQQPLEEFFKSRDIKVRNEMAEESMMAKTLKEAQESSDEEVAGADRGSADEDSEEEDEDFKDEDESDVAEEFDSNVGSSSSAGSDAEMEDADGDADEGEDTAAKVERPKKKPKTK
ncbi:MAG: hypothetical protein Q9162_000010 [Coniocarpon cinnabarinum]